MNTPKPTPIPPFHRRIPSQLEAVDLLCSDLRDHLASHNLAHAHFTVELLARECLNNGILHGNRSNPRKHAEFELRVGPRWIRLQITDQGAGFPWRRRPRSATPDPSRAGGRGLALCSSYAARVRLNQSGNQITLWLGR